MTTDTDIAHIIHQLIHLIDQKDDKISMEENTLAHNITALETRFSEELQNQQIADIYLDPNKEKLYLETHWSPDLIPETIISVDINGIITKEKITPDHVIFDLYAAEETDETDEI